MKQLATILLASTLSMSAFSEAYVSMKNKTSWMEDESMTFDGSKTHLRFGFQDRSLYAEAGVVNGGTSWEAGYKFKSFANGLTLSGKAEATNIDEWNYTVETRLRYTFK